jgi:AcrR family transcriptional regulator
MPGEGRITCIRWRAGHPQTPSDVFPVRIYQGADTAAPVSGFSISPGTVSRKGVRRDRYRRPDEGSRAEARRFYANFKSKEELMAKSCERTLAELVENWTKVTSKAKREPLRAIVAGYLSISHRDDPANGCVVAALGLTSPARAAVRHAVTEGVRPFIDLLTRSVLVAREPRAAKGRWRYTRVWSALRCWLGWSTIPRIETNTYGCSGIGVTAFSSLRCGFRDEIVTILRLAQRSTVAKLLQIFVDLSSRDFQALGYSTTNRFTAVAFSATCDCM